MRVPSLLCAVVALAAPAPAALAAACTSAGEAAAKPLAMDAPQAGANLWVNLGLWLGVLDKQGLDAGVLRKGDACERGRFRAGSTAYVLRGEDKDGAAPRVATPGSRRQPTGYLLQVPDIGAAMRPAGRDKPAPTLGYALMTTAGGAHTAWRVYDAIPADAVLLADMEAALSGRLRPMLRWRAGQVEIILPAKPPEG